MALRIVFAGSPTAAVPSLRALAATDHEIVAVVTRDDAPLGRKRVLTPTPIAETATALGIPVIKGNRIGSLEARIAALRPDLGVVVAYGGLIREPLLSTPRLGWINLHFSLLPRWRGAAPVQHAVISGDQKTGAAVFQLVPELDAGPVFATVEQPIGRHETAGHLLDVLAERGAELLVSVVDGLDAGTARSVPQEGDVTFAPKLDLDAGGLDWSRPAAELDARIRGTTPEPGAFTLLAGPEADSGRGVDADSGRSGGDRLKVLDAATAHGEAALPPGAFELRAGRLLVGTGTDPLHLVTVQPAGKRPMPGADWWRGRTR